MYVAENHSPHGLNKSKSAPRLDLKVLLMMDIAGESMVRKTFLVLNILGNKSISSHVLYIKCTKNNYMLMCTYLMNFLTQMLCLSKSYKV